MVGVLLGSPEEDRSVDLIVSDLPFLNRCDFDFDDSGGRGTSARQGLAAVLRSCARVLKEQRNEGGPGLALLLVQSRHMLEDALRYSDNCLKLQEGPVVFNGFCCAVAWAIGQNFVWPCRRCEKSATVTGPCVPPSTGSTSIHLRLSLLSPAWPLARSLSCAATAQRRDRTASHHVALLQARKDPTDIGKINGSHWETLGMHQDVQDLQAAVHWAESPLDERDAQIYTPRPSMVSSIASPPWATSDSEAEDETVEMCGAPARPGSSSVSKVQCLFSLQRICLLHEDSWATKAPWAPSAGGGHHGHAEASQIAEMLKDTKASQPVKTWSRRGFGSKSAANAHSLCRDVWAHAARARQFPDAALVLACQLLPAAMGGPSFSPTTWLCSGHLAQVLPLKGNIFAAFVNAHRLFLRASSVSLAMRLLHLATSEPTGAQAPKTTEAPEFPAAPTQQATELLASATLAAWEILALPSALYLLPPCVESAATACFTSPLIVATDPWIQVQGLRLSVMDESMVDGDTHVSAQFWRSETMPAAGERPLVTVDVNLKLTPLKIRLHARQLCALQEWVADLQEVEAIAWTAPSESAPSASPASPAAAPAAPAAPAPAAASRVRLALSLRSSIALDVSLVAGEEKVGEEPRKRAWLRVNLSQRGEQPLSIFCSSLPIGLCVAASPLLTFAACFTSQSRPKMPSIVQKAPAPAPKRAETVAEPIHVQVELGTVSLRLFSGNSQANGVAFLVACVNEARARSVGPGFEGQAVLSLSLFEQRQARSGSIASVEARDVGVKPW
eukprot:s1466_g3.t1